MCCEYCGQCPKEQVDFIHWSSVCFDCADSGQIEEWESMNRDSLTSWKLY